MRKGRCGDVAGAPRLPVQWVMLDPQGESLALTRVLQPENMWAAQLERSRDVVQQSAAVAGLASLSPSTYGVVNSLRACLFNRNVFSRCLCGRTFRMAQFTVVVPRLFYTILICR